MPRKPAKCEHIKTNGVRCGSPALRGLQFCYFHACSLGSAFGFVPLLEDGNAIQLGLGEVIRAIIDERIDTKRAGLLIYALQVASHNLPNVDFAPAAHKVTLEPPIELRHMIKPTLPAKAEPTSDDQAPSAKTGTDG